MAKKLVRSFSLVIILSILLAQFGLRPVIAAGDFVVSSNVDEVDANPGDGLCQTARGECSLRAAVQEANALGGADAISIPAGTYTLSIPGAGEDSAATGDLDINESLTITGAGVGATVLDAGNLDREFDVHGGTLTLSDLTVQHGLADPGGGVLVNSSASIMRVSFINNQSTSDASNGTGGAVFVSVEGSADIAQSLFKGNFAYFGGGAVANANATRLSISDSTFDANSSTLGGGALYLNGGSA